MRIGYPLVFAALSLVLVPCSSPRALTRETKETSVDQLLSSRNQFDATRVAVRGFLLLPEVGDLALYATEADYWQHRQDRSIRVNAERQKTNLMAFQLKVWLLDGTLHASQNPAARGLLDEITRFELAK